MRLYRVLLFAGLVGVAAQPAGAQHTVYAEITLARLPESYADFAAAYRAAGTQPEDVIALYIAALHLFTQDAAAGTQALTQLVDPELLQIDAKAPGGYTLKRTDLSLLHAQLQRPIVHSYIQGTQPDAGYALPAPPYTLVILRSKMTDAKEGQFLLKSSGTSSPRPILLVQRAAVVCARLECPAYACALSQRKTPGQNWPAWV